MPSTAPTEQELLEAHRELVTKQFSSMPSMVLEPMYHNMFSIVERIKLKDPSSLTHREKEMIIELEVLTKLLNM